MFGPLGGPELFLILVVALIVFGPRKLPEIGKSVGKMMGEFRKASNDFRRTIEDEVEAEKIREATRLDPPSWTTPEPAALPAASEPVATPAAELSAAATEVAPEAPAPATPPADTVSREADALTK
jgi:sec-independent protein translocase protein TatB